MLVMEITSFLYNKMKIATLEILKDKNSIVFTITKLLKVSLILILIVEGALDLILPTIVGLIVSKRLKSKMI